MAALCISVLALVPLSTAPPAPAPASPVAPLAIQDEDEEEEEFVDKRPEVKEKLAALADHIKKRGKEDVEAIAVIDDLLQEFPRSGPKDRASIVKGLDACFKQKRQETSEGVRDNGLFRAAAVCLGQMAPESVKPLNGWIGHKSHRKDLTLQRDLILSLGKTKHEDGIDTLTKLLNDDQPLIQAAGAEALGEYEGMEVKDRKEVFHELLKCLMRVRAKIDQDPNDIIEHDRWNVISAPIVTSLQRLSGHNEYDAFKWEAWWNNNKKKDWDEDEG